MSHKIFGFFVVVCICVTCWPVLGKALEGEGDGNEKLNSYIEAQTLKLNSHAGVMNQVCFPSKIEKVTASPSGIIEYKIEDALEIPAYLSGSGCVGSFLITTQKPGYVANIFVDTADGHRTNIVVKTHPYQLASKVK